MKILSKTLAMILICQNAYGQSASIPNNTLVLGKTGSVNKILEFNLTKGGASTNPRFRWNNGSSFFDLSNDGTTFSRIARYSDKLSDFAATSSSELAGIISDETGSGSSVFGTSPSITTPSITSPTVDGNFILTQEVDSSSAGSNVELTVSKPTIILTNVSLTSVGSIASPITGKTIVLLNKTGASVSIVNEYASATAANRIITGTGSDLTLSSNASILIQYNNNNSRWHIVGGSGSGSASSNGNRLTNGDYESSTTGWTASGGTLSTTSTAANVYEGVSSGTWDSNSASQTLTSPTVTVGGLSGTNGEMTCYTQTPSGTATHTLGIWDGSTLTQTTTINSSSNYVATTINFTFPSSGTVAARLTSVAADEPQINHECYIGPTRNITSGVIITPWTATSGITITGTTSNPTKGTTSTDRVLWRRVGSNAEIRYEYVQTGAGSAGSGDYLIALPTGLSMDSTKVSFFTTVIGAAASAESNAVGSAKIGSTTNGAMSVVAYDATKVRLMGVASTPSSGTFSSAYYALSASSISFNITMSVPISGWAAGSAVNADQTDYDWTSYTPTFTGFGTVTSPECQHSRVASNLLLRCKYTTGTTTATEARISLPSGLTSADTNKIPSIQLAGTNSVNATLAGSLTVLIEPSVTYVTLGKQSGTENGLVKRNGNDFPSSTTFAINASIPIQGWSSNQRAPTLVGSVTSNANNAHRIETTLANCSTSSSVTSGDFLSSPSNISSGVCTYTMSAGYSTTPKCFITKNDNTATNTIWGAKATSTTSLSVTCYANAAACTGGGDINIMCIGDR